MVSWIQVLINARAAMHHTGSLDATAPLPLGVAKPVGLHPCCYKTHLLDNLLWPKISMLDGIVLPLSISAAPDLGRVGGGREMIAASSAVTLVQARGSICWHGKQCSIDSGRKLSLPQHIRGRYFCWCCLDIPGTSDVRLCFGSHTELC